MLIFCILTFGEQECKLNKLTNNNIFKDVRVVVRCSCHGGTKNKENCVTSVEKHTQVTQADHWYPLKIYKIKHTDYKQNVGYKSEKNYSQTSFQFKQR